MTPEEKPAAPEAAVAAVSSGIAEAVPATTPAEAPADNEITPVRHARSRASRAPGRRTSRRRATPRTENSLENPAENPSESLLDSTPPETAASSSAATPAPEASPAAEAAAPARAASRAGTRTSRSGGRSRGGTRKGRTAAPEDLSAAPVQEAQPVQEAPSFVSSVETGASVQQETVLRDMEQAAAPARKKRSSRRGRKAPLSPEGDSAQVQAAAAPLSLALPQVELTPPAPAADLAPVLVTPEQKALVPVEHAAPAAAEDAETATEAPASAATEEEGESPRRKSRRGRRGGRGRSRKNRQTAEDGQEAPAAPVETEEPAIPPLSDGPEEIEDSGQAAEADGEEDSDLPAEDGATESAKKGGIRAAAVKAKAAAASGRQRMFISVLPGEQVEVALTEEGVLLEYYLDMLHQKKLKGNIYKGVIHNIDTNLQAAFVSYGAGKNGFLQIDEIHPEYWLTHHEPAKGKKYPPIQKVLKAGQEVLVQVVKEPNGSKGAFLTTWLSLAGRFLVLTPGQEQIGVSRKVDSDEERARLREMMNGIDPGEGLGVIVRTVSAGVTKTTLKSDLQYLKRVWKDIRKRATEVTAPALVHEEPGLPERAVRDYLTDEVCEIWVDNEELASSIRDMVSQLFPRKKDLVRLHSDPRHSMWERFNLRRQLDQIYSREVTMPSGGRLVFDQTEALMAVDINSGKISGKANFESMAFRTNLEAAETIARQLRLRDIGGQVVIDFIEMRDRKHVAEVEKTLRMAMKNDRARHDIGRMSSFGLLELVRQRMGSSALAISMEPCPHCNGTGQRRNREWQSLQALRDLRSLLRSQSGGDKVVFETTAEVGMYLLNHKRDTLRDLENSFGKSIEICLRP
ncbi:Rne/Rng family ribonuclease [uncultured Desulfovibrio sp.]|uniref:Rne/Rng family ribonuclease n=1 Tax=uncultured Desulfovibrio sp. TaxID=167968 RepID=UPI002608B02B|nr:Rne/Rng family ribonuclease [uncultured Desulfovibrio sp.]